MRPKIKLAPRCDCGRLAEFKFAGESECARCRRLRKWLEQQGKYGRFTHPNCQAA